MEMTWVRIPLKIEENDQSRDDVEKDQMAKSTRSENKSEKLHQKEKGEVGITTTPTTTKTLTTTTTTTTMQDYNNNDKNSDDDDHNNISAGKQ